ncbi:hypothetical protein DW178_06525 [Eggerthella sp. AM16-19]|nr:hypothetical protein DW178_06525 [Eggerthella sp. AM16-19]
MRFRVEKQPVQYDKKQFVSQDPIAVLCIFLTQLGPISTYRMGTLGANPRRLMIVDGGRETIGCIGLR